MRLNEGFSILKGENSVMGVSFKVSKTGSRFRHKLPPELEVPSPENSKETSEIVSKNEAAAQKVLLFLHSNFVDEENFME